MHQDKKREELEEIKEFERMQQEEALEQTVETDRSVAEVEQTKQDESFEKEKVEETPVENEIERAKRKRKEMIFELALFCILGILLGVTIKTEAVKRITIGFNDYQIETGKQRYDIAGMKKNLEQKALEAQQAQQPGSAQDGGQAPEQAPQQ